MKKKFDEMGKMFEEKTEEYKKIIKEVLQNQANV